MTGTGVWSGRWARGAAAGVLAVVAATAGGPATSAAGGTPYAMATAAAVTVEVAQDVSAGSYSTCALTSVGGLRCWGSNVDGALGTGPAVRESLVPLDVPGLTTGVKAVSVDGSQVCAVTVAGAVRCWGRGNEATATFTPTTVPGLTSGVRSISVGADHACAVTATRGVICWGDNQHGELGDGTVTTSTSPQPPVRVVGLPDGVLAVSAGASHTCAITVTHATLCWGDNLHGQLGDGSRATRSTPVTVTALGSQALRISAGQGATCAVTTTHAARCWGGNPNGELGVGDHVDRLVPTPVVGLSSGVTQITRPSGYHTCAVVSGRAWCWGLGVYTQLGDGISFSDHPTPIAVSRLGPGVVRMSAGFGDSCAVKAIGAVYCWGFNRQGQLGVGDPWITHKLPSRVVGF